MPDADEGLVLLVDKPAGITSHDVVARVRRERGVKRVGHAGTLDPFATGLLIVLVGRTATREQARFMAQRKAYRVLVRFGAVSTTGDRDGEITQTGRLPGNLALPTGEIQQVPPAYSAIKIGGERAYKKARRGEAVEMPPRQVSVYRFDELWREGDRGEFHIECSSGTYVRSLVADLGDAYCEELRRVAIGPFGVEGAGEGREVSLTAALERLAEAEAGRVTG